MIRPEWDNAERGAIGLRTMLPIVTRRTPEVETLATFEKQMNWGVTGGIR
jgi:hypothetical protein